MRILVPSTHSCSRVDSALESPMHARTHTHADSLSVGGSCCTRRRCMAAASTAAAAAFPARLLCQELLVSLEHAIEKRGIVHRPIGDNINYNE